MFIEIRGCNARIGISAPKSYRIIRTELIKLEQQQRADVALQKLSGGF